METGKPSEWNVVFDRRRFGFAIRLRRGSGGSRGAGSAGGGGLTAVTIDELKRFSNDAEFALLLIGLLIFPGVELQAAFDQDGPALLKILTDDLSGAPESIDVDKRNFFLRLASFIFPGAIDGQTELCNGGPFGGVAQLGIAGQVSEIGRASCRERV